MKHRIRYPIVHSTAAAALLLSMQASADTGTIAVATELKSAPDITASTVSQLTLGSSVQVGERKGAWYKVTSPQGEGWVKMLNVRLGNGTRAQGASASSGMAALGDATRSNTTVATGIRGLSREDLKSAQEDLNEVARLDQFTVSRAEALAFGASAGLPAPMNDQDEGR